MDIGERIRERRVQLNLNQVELGERSGVNPVTISQIERGANTTIETLQKLAEAMDTSLVALMCPQPLLSKEQIEQLVSEVSQHLRDPINCEIRHAINTIVSSLTTKLHRSNSPPGLRIVPPSEP